MRPCAINFLVTPTVTPPAVSVNIPSVSASSLIPSTIESSSAAVAVPFVCWSTYNENGPAAGFPIASDFAIVLGLTGRTSLDADSNA